MSERQVEKVPRATDAGAVEIPVHSEARRLQALHACGILDTPPEPAFDDLAKLAGAVCRAPIALVSLVDGERQWSKARVGLEAAQTPRATSFCAHAIQQPDDLFVVRDARQDDRFRDSPLVAGAPFVRFYAGAPLVTREGERLGTLCVMDVEPRALDEHQREALRVLARQVSTQLEFRRAAAESRRLRSSAERTRESLAFQAALLEAQVEAMPVGLLVISPGGEIVWYNGRFCDIWGVADDLVERADDAELMRAMCARVADPDAFRARVQALYDKPEDVAHDVVAFKDGRVFDRYSAPVRGEDGAYYGRIWTFRDITEERRTRRRMAELLSQVDEQRRRLDAIVASVPGVVWETWDAPDESRQRVDFVSDHVEAMLGYTPEEWVSTRGFWLSIVHPDDRERVARENAEIFARGGTGSVAFRWMTKDGRALHVVSKAVVVKDDAGRAVGMRGVTVDVSEQRRAVEAMRRSEERFRLLARATNDVVRDWDLEQGSVWWNDNFYEMFGYLVDEVEPGENSWTSRIHPDDAERVLAGLRNAIDGRADTWSDEYRFRRKDGEYADIFDRAFIIRDERGNATRTVGSMMDVTERRRARDALALSEERFRSLVKASSQIVWTARADGDMVEESSSWRAFTGQTEEQRRGAGWLEAVHDEDREETERAWRDAVRSGRPYETVYRLRRADGSWAVTLTRGVPVLNEDGTVREIVGMNVDVTEQRAIEDALQRERTLLETILHQMPAGVIVAEAPSGRLVLANARVNEILCHDFRPAEGIAQYAKYPAFSPDGEPLDPREYPLARAITGETVRGAEILYERGDGERVSLLINAAPVRSPDGTIIAAVADFIDITERKGAEEALRASEEQYRFLANAVPGQVWTATPDGRLDYVNGRAVEFFGRHAEEVLGEGWQAVVHPDDLPEAVRRWTRSLRTGDPYEVEFRLRRHDGAYRWHIARASALRDASGAVVRWFGANVDITDNKEAQGALKERATELARLADELREQRNLIRIITDNAGSALFMMDRHGHPTFMNPAACEMTGYSGVDEIKDKPLHDAIHFKRPDGSHYPMEECPIDQANAEIVPLKGQREVFCRKDGTLFPVEYNVAPVRRDGEPFGAVIEVRDITRQEQAERELRQRADELAELAAALERSNRELDQFAYVTSHDLKAPLRGIANLATWIEEDLGDAVDEDSRKHLDLLRGRVHRMESLIDAILQYSRVGRIKVTPEPVRVDDLLQEAVDLLSPPDGFRVEWARPMPELVAERSRLQQVFLNLIGNAVKHHHEPAKGLVRIDAEDEGDFWRFTLSDNGPGIAPRFHEKIFVIFQTLEARDKVEGTGVGLALVKKIVQTQGGTIEIDSDEGRGATFRFTWPKQPPAQPEKHEQASATEEPRVR